MKRVPLLLAFLVFSLAPRPALAQVVSTTTDGNVITAAMEELSPDLRERARALGYADGEKVSLRMQPDGELVVAPKTPPIETPQELQARFIAVVAEKIVKKVTPTLEFSARVDAENGEVDRFELRAPFRELQKPVQEAARGKGFGKADVVPVAVDPKTWEWTVGAKTRASFSAQLEEVIPGKTPEEPPTLRIRANFEDLTPAEQAEATKLGYVRTGSVRLESVPGAGFKVLPRQFEIGLSEPFGKMKPKDQAEAVKLGYQEGDAVWSEFTPSGVNLVPKSRVGDGPVMEILGGEVVTDTSGRPAIMMICLTKFDRLAAERRKEAERLGYKPGDDVGLHYDPKAGKFIVLEPGKARRVVVP